MPRKEVYQKYKKQTIKYNREWAKRNPEKIRDYEKRYILNNPEKRKESVRKYDLTHKERRKRWEAKNGDRLKEYHRVYRKKHPGHHRAQSRKRRNLLKNLKEHHTPLEWEDLKRQYGYQCLWCGKREPEIKLAADHITPLLLGGSDTIDNIQPLCPQCNARKSKRIIDFRTLRKQQNLNETMADLPLQGLFIPPALTSPSGYGLCCVEGQISELRAYGQAIQPREN